MYLNCFPNKCIVLLEIVNSLSQVKSVMRDTYGRQIVGIKTRWIHDVVAQAASKVLVRCMACRSQKGKGDSTASICIFDMGSHPLQKYLLVSLGDHKPGLSIISSAPSSF